MKTPTFLVSMDVMSLDTNIQQNAGILKLSVTKHMKISTKTTHSYTLLAGNASILKENFFHFSGKDYLQNHGTAMGTKTADLIPLPIFS